MSKYKAMLMPEPVEEQSSGGKYKAMLDPNRQQGFQPNRGAGDPTSRVAGGGTYSDESARVAEIAAQRNAAGDEGFERVGERGADLSTIAATSFADDPARKIEFYAQKRFPDLPIEEAVGRYGLVNGEIVYKGDDEKLYTETPSMMDRIAKHIGKGIPMVAGTAAGVVTAPMWLTGPAGGAASAGLTGGAAYAGEEIRQELGKKFLGDPVSKTEPLKEGALAAGGEAIGGMVTRGMARGAARDIGKMSVEDADVLQRLSKKYGIDLTPAEITDLPSLKARQKALGNLTDSGDTMQRFYNARGEQVDRAVGKYLDDISPVDSAELAGLKTRDAAVTSIKSAKKARQAASKDLYAQVDDPSNLVDPDAFKVVSDDEYLSGIVKDIKTDPLYGRADMPDNSLPVLDAVKKELDDRIESAVRSGANNKARVLRQKREQLLGMTDESFDFYPEARKAFAGASPEVDQLEKGLVGIISKLKDTNAKDAARKLFSKTSSGPEAVKAAKRAIRSTDPEAWQAVKRAWLQDSWDNASKQYATTSAKNKGAKFSSFLLGDARNKKIMREMLDPSEYRTLDDLSQVLDAASRVKAVGSDTAWNQEIMKIAREEATPAYAKVAEKINVLGWPRMIKDWATEKNLREMSERMADIVTSPGAMAELKELRKVTPGSARAAVLTAHLLGIGAVESASAALE